MTTLVLDAEPNLRQQQAFTGFHFFCLVTGQMLMCASSFLWNDAGRYTINGSTLIILSMVFWTAGLIGVFQIFRTQNPWYSRVGLLYGIYGCFGGVAFGFEGLFSEIFQVGPKIGVNAHEQFPLQMNLVLYWAGPAFPLSMLLLGAFAIYHKKVKVLTGVLLILGALSFPVSRILRVEWIAHLADLTLLVGISLLAIEARRGSQQDRSLMM